MADKIITLPLPDDWIKEIDAHPDMEYLRTRTTWIRRAIRRDLDNTKE